MPRNGSGVYNLPLGTEGVPGTPVESAPYNAFVADVENDLNLPRPIVAGGTGASTPAQAIANLGGLPLAGGNMTGHLTVNYANPAISLRTTGAGQTRLLVGTDYAASAARWSVALGDSAAESGSNAGSDFSINSYTDAGAFLATPLSIKRSDGVVTLAHTLNLAATQAIKFSGNNAVYRSGNYLALADSFAGASLGAILIGNLTDPVTYYDNTTHIWRNRVPSNMMALNASALQVFSGIFANATGNVLETSAAYTVLREAANGSGAKITLGAAADPANYHDNTLHSFRGRGATPVFASISVGGIVVNGALSAETVWADKTNGGSSSNLFGFYRSGVYRYQFYNTGGMYWACDIGSGNLGWYSSGATELYSFQNDGNFVVHVGSGYKPGGGTWTATSDARIKTVNGTFNHGLASVCELTPRRFTYKGNDSLTDPAMPRAQDGVPNAKSPRAAAAPSQKEYVGFVAQEIEALGLGALMVSKREGYIDGAKVTDLREIDTTPLIYALVNAVKQLAARVEQLEGR